MVNVLWFLNSALDIPMVSFNSDTPTPLKKSSYSSIKSPELKFGVYGVSG